MAQKKKKQVTKKEQSKLHSFDIFLAAGDQCSQQILLHGRQKEKKQTNKRMKEQNTGREKKKEMTKRNVGTFKENSFFIIIYFLSCLEKRRNFAERIRGLLFQVIHQHHHSCMERHLLKLPRKCEEEK